jgi:hypothetical protein
MTDTKSTLVIQDPGFEKAWEEHILRFFTARLPGNESNFNFTEILANFPFMLEWVIQNRPVKPYSESLNTEYCWWNWCNPYKQHIINGYDIRFISAHPGLTPELVLKYIDFPWDINVLKRRFENDREALSRLESIIPTGTLPIDDTVYNSIINLVIPQELRIIDKPDEKVDEQYIPILLTSKGEEDYFNPPALPPPPPRNPNSNPLLCSVAIGPMGPYEIPSPEYQEILSKFPIRICDFSPKVWDYFSFSPLVPWEFIKANPKLPWNRNFVFRSTRFAPEFFMTRDGDTEAWDGRTISGYRRMTFDLINHLERKCVLDWTIISYCDFREEKDKFYANYSSKQCNTNRSISLGLNRTEVKISEIARSQPAATDLSAQVIACYPEATKIICLTLGSDAVLGYMCSRNSEAPRDLLIIDAEPLKSIDGYPYPDCARFDITDSRGYDFIRAEIERELFIFVSVEPLTVWDIYEIFMGDIPVNGRVVSLFD